MHADITTPYFGIIEERHVVTNSEKTEDVHSLSGCVVAKCKCEVRIWERLIGCRNIQKQDDTNDIRRLLNSHPISQWLTIYHTYRTKPAEDWFVSVHNKTLIQNSKGKRDHYSTTREHDASFLVPQCTECS